MEGKFLVYDRLTEKPVGAYSTREEANKTMDNLVERDLERLIKYLEEEMIELACTYNLDMGRHRFDIKMLERQLNEMKSGELKVGIWLGANNIVRYMTFDLTHGYDYKAFLRDSVKPLFPLRVKTLWLNHEALDLLAQQKEQDEKYRKEVAVVFDTFKQEVVGVVEPLDVNKEILRLNTADLERIVDFEEKRSAENAAYAGTYAEQCLLQVKQQLKFFKHGHGQSGYMYGNDAVNRYVGSYFIVGEPKSVKLSPRFFCPDRIRTILGIPLEKGE